ncbi:MAG: STAS domain-containing protein [Pirellulales bacterium]|nr:STAS domain-containing protein [Pirellulales bacterium]
MLQTCQTEEKTCLTFEGSLDTAVCVEIESEVHGVVADSDSPIEFNLADVDFVASSFLRLCIHAYQHSGDQFQIVHANPMVRRVFKIAGLDRMLGDE